MLNRVDINGQFLLQAAEYMEEHGWCHNGDWEDEEGGVCLVQALKRVGGSNMNTINRLRQVVGTMALPEWNDHCCKSKEEAVAALRAAAFVVIEGH